MLKNLYVIIEIISVNFTDMDLKNNGQTIQNDWLWEMKTKELSSNRGHRKLSLKS